MLEYIKITIFQKLSAKGAIRQHDVADMTRSDRHDGQSQYFEVLLFLGAVGVVQVELSQAVLATAAAATSTGDREVAMKRQQRQEEEKPSAGTDGGSTRGPRIGLAMHSGTKEAPLPSQPTADVVLALVLLLLGVLEM